jgi:diacylglycerol kinase
MNKFSILARLKSFKYAFAGIKHVIVHEHNARVHLAATILIVIAGLYFNLSTYEWIAIIFAITLVWITEMLNTIIEMFVNHLWPSYNPLAGRIKDIAAAVVLVCAIMSVIIAAFIFLPKLF